MIRSKKATQLHHLPANVLESILSRLLFTEAARVSVLSRELRQLGVGLLHPDLVFTRATFLGSSDAAAWATSPARATADFITLHDGVLRPLWSSATITVTTLDSFVVQFGLRINHTFHVDRWIRFSMASRAKRIALDFTEGARGGGK